MTPLVEQAIERRPFLRLTAGALAAASGCRRSVDPANGRGSKVIVAHEVSSNPFRPDSSLHAPLFLSLVRVGVSGEVEGRLAQHWEHTKDYRTWTVRLRTDVKWHDGIPVTAHDVKFTLDLLMHPEVLAAAPRAYSVTVLDDNTYTITYQRKSGGAGVRGSPLDDLTVYYPRHLLEHLDPKAMGTWNFWNRPVGNGPYRYLRQVPETMVELEANPDHDQGRPRIERVVFKFVRGSGAAGYAELLSGGVDIIEDANELRLPREGLDPRFRAYPWYVRNSGRAIMWQHSHPIFGDVRVRTALTMAINRRELLPVINLLHTTPLTDGPYTVRQLRRGLLPAPRPYDQERARALLDEAGWRVRREDGIRERNGKPFRFTAIVGRPPMHEVAVYLQDQFRRVGVRMDLLPLDPAAFFPRLDSGEYEAAIAYYYGDTGWLRRNAGRDAVTGYRSSRVADLIDQADDSLDPDVTDNVYGKLWDIFRAEAPVTFLFPMVYFDFVHRRVRGLSSPWRADPVEAMEHLWLDDGKH